MPPRGANSKAAPFPLTAADVGVWAMSASTRNAVTNCIKDSIKRMPRCTRRLRHHLQSAVVTGTYCLYAPQDER